MSKYKGKQLNEQSFNEVRQAAYNKKDSINKKLNTDFQDQMNYINFANFAMPELRQAVDELWFNPMNKTQDRKLHWFEKLSPEAKRTIFYTEPTYEPRIYIEPKQKLDTIDETYDKLSKIGYKEGYEIQPTEYARVKDSKSLKANKTLTNKLQKLYEQTESKLQTASSREWQNIIDSYD